MNFIYAHLIGDYLIQNDWMAANKKKSTFACLVHVTTYMIPFLFVGLSPLQFALIFVEHFIQDRTNIVMWFMEKKGSGYFAKEMAPWSVILTDNILHILFMALVITH